MRPRITWCSTRISKCYIMFNHILKVHHGNSGLMIKTGPRYLLLHYYITAQNGILSCQNSNWQNVQINKFRLQICLFLFWDRLFQPKEKLYVIMYSTYDLMGHNYSPSNSFLLIGFPSKTTITASPLYSWISQMLYDDVWSVSYKMCYRSNYRLL